MNAAARLVHQNVLSRQLALTHLLSHKQISVLLLGIAILLSSISLIYLTYLSRGFYATYQHSLHEYNQLQSLRRQLLLERSTGMMQTRVQSIAQHRLGMFAPDYQSTIVIGDADNS